MGRVLQRLGVCTTIYPGVEQYLGDWYTSLLRQTDREYQLWIAVDGLDIDRACQAMGGRPDAIWVNASVGSSPAEIRQLVFARVAEACDGIVLVDSDDIMHPERLATARASLEQYDLVACALRLVDQLGNDMGKTLKLTTAENSPEKVLPRHNVFGLSNTAWRSTLLQRCLPIPAEVEIVDWFLATRAWLTGAKLAFNSNLCMNYRQHTSNMVRVCAPYNRDQVLRDTKRVCDHFRHVQSLPPEGALDIRLVELAAVAEEVEQFAAWARASPELMDKYIHKLNALDPEPIWWSSVAHPILKQLWSA
jgi:hypothetical protein